MKQLKPFKVGATYKLREECRSSLVESKYMRLRGFDRDRLVNDGFTVYELSTDNIACCDGIVIAWPSERHMFYRVDNKKTSECPR